MDSILCCCRVGRAGRFASCQGLAGPAGPAGAKGDPGTSGPGTEGPPGTTDNLLPVATAIPTVYLALNGVEAPAKAHKGLIPSDSYITKTVPLGMYFKDAESATLSYTAVSTDKTTATAKVAADGKLLITGVKAGPTTITVTAFDGVNAGVEATIDVIVVANNRPPTAGVIQTILDLTGPRKLVSNSPLTIAFTAAISPGASGEPTETIADFRTALDTPKLVDAEVTAVSGNDYILTITRKASGTDDVSGTQEITIFAQDSFGAETMVDLNGPFVMGVSNAPDTGTASLVAEVNAPPRLVLPVRDVVLYRFSEVVNNDASLAPTMKYGSTVFNIADFFAVEYDDDATTDVNERDTTCVFTTSPPQPTGLAAIVAAPGGASTPPVAASAHSPITATTMASVVGANEAGIPTAQLETLTVDSSPADTLPATMTLPGSVPAEGLGDFDLTITCSDAETFATGTWKITVRP